MCERVQGGKEKGVFQGQWEKKLRGSQLMSLCDPGACNCILPCIHLRMYTKIHPTQCQIPHFPHLTRHSQCILFRAVFIVFLGRHMEQVQLCILSYF